MKTIAEYLEKNAEKMGERTYITFERDGNLISKSYVDFASDVKAVASSLLMKYKQGSTFALYSGNSYEWTVLDISFMGYTGICVPIDKEWTAHDLENTLSFIKVDVLFYSKEKSGTISEIKDKFTDIQFYCIEDEFEKLISEGIKSEPVSQTDMNETVKIIFSSGTTAFPKAIPLTQSNLFSNWETLYSRTPMSEKDLSCIFLPLNHVYSGIANFLYSLISGMQLHICGSIHEHAADIIRFRPTVVCTVPLLLKKLWLSMTPELLEAMKEIRYLYCGGSFTEPQVKRWFRENGINLLEAYGTTETSSVIALDLVDEECLESNGTIFENLDVKIIEADEEGFGEILVKGESRSTGYINYPLNERYFDSDGYFHTGDLGKVDSRNRLFLKGRKKRMLETSDGKNVYADEIEELILETGMAAKATVYLEKHRIAAKIYTDISSDKIMKIIDEINEKLPYYKKIQYLYVSSDEMGKRIK